MFSRNALGVVLALLSVPLIRVIVTGEPPVSTLLYVAMWTALVLMFPFAVWLMRPKNKPRV
jgi:hypothetical protein